MSDNQDLKSKILSMRQKNFGNIINETNEKNDNVKPENHEINHDKVNTELVLDKDEINLNTDEESIQHEISPNISDLKENLNNVSKTNITISDILIDNILFDILCFST